MIKINMNYDTDPLSKYTKALDIMGPVQRHMDRFILQGVLDYTPIDTGRLSVSSVARHVPGSGRIEWDTPYATNLWYGKTSTGKDMKFNQTIHKNAGPYWAERYKSENISAIQRELEEAVRRI